MNEDDPDFMRKLSARLEEQRDDESDERRDAVIVLHAALPARVWGAMLAEEEYALRAERMAMFWLVLFSGVTVLYVLKLMWWPVAVVYIALGVACALHVLRFHRVRAARFASIVGFITRAREDDDEQS